jgi:hypothetical protein
MINKQLIIDPASEYFYLWEEPPIEPGNLFDIYHLQLIFSYSKYTIFLKCLKQLLIIKLTNSFYLRNANLFVQRHELGRLDEREGPKDTSQTSRSIRLQRNVDKNERHISQVIN